MTTFVGVCPEGQDRGRGGCNAYLLLDKDGLLPWHLDAPGGNPCPGAGKKPRAGTKRTV